MQNIETPAHSNYYYYLQWNFEEILNQYTSENGYLIFRPWRGGLNNIRMSLELAVSIAYLSNKTLVIPPRYDLIYYSIKNFGVEYLFDTEDFGIHTIPFTEFCLLKNIEKTYDAVREISVCVPAGPDMVLNFETMLPEDSFTKKRKITDTGTIVTNNECVFFDGNLLGNFYQTIHTNRDIELKKLIAKHVHYLPFIMDEGWKAISWLGDKQYYTIHVRRDDFQFKNLFINIEELHENIKNLVPLGARLYIATDHKDLSYFNLLKESYDIIFYNDVVLNAHIDVDTRYIPAIEQLICTRGVRFIGNEHSTLSSYIYRLRGYMRDIYDKEYYINTSGYQIDEQKTFKQTEKFIGNWSRDFRDVWEF